MRALRSRPFALLWTGQTISVLGDAVFTIAITWEVLILTGSSTAMSLLVIAQWGPKVLLLAYGGVIADRLPRRLLMLWADAGRGCIVFVVAWLAWTHALQFWQLLVLAPLLGYGTDSSLFGPYVLLIHLLLLKSVIPLRKASVVQHGRLLTVPSTPGSSCRHQPTVKKFFLLLICLFCENIRECFLISLQCSSHGVLLH